MSRIGKVPIIIPAGVSYRLENKAIIFEGPGGLMTIPLHKLVSVKEVDGNLLVETRGSSKLAKALSGTFRALLFNAVKGITEGWKKELELIGTGYRVEMSGDGLKLTLGFSHPIEVKAPEGIKFTLTKNIILIEGVDKAQVGQVAAEIRKLKPPEPYKGKGILYVGEKVRRKAGKAAKAQGAV